MGVKLFFSPQRHLTLLVQVPNGEECSPAGVEHFGIKVCIRGKYSVSC